MRQVLIYPGEDGYWVAETIRGHVSALEEGVLLRRNDPFAQVVVPDHRELDRGTLRAILRQAGVEVARFIEALERTETATRVSRARARAGACDILSGPMTNTSPSFARDDLLAAVRALAPRLRAASDEIETSRSLTEPLVQARSSRGRWLASTANLDRTGDPPSHSGT